MAADARLQGTLHAIRRVFLKQRQDVRARVHGSGRPPARPFFADLPRACVSTRLRAPSRGRGSPLEAGPPSSPGPGSIWREPVDSPTNSGRRG